MKRPLGTAFVAVLFLGSCGLAQAADAGEVNAILDKGIQALGGAQKLSAAEAVSWKSKGTVRFDDSGRVFTGQTIMQGLDHMRQEFEGETGGMKVKGVLVLQGDRGWDKFGDMKTKLDQKAVANMKRAAYLQVIPTTLVPLKGKGFKVEAVGEEKVGGKSAVVLKVVPADGQEFTLYLDKESGLPVKQVAKVTGIMGDEYTEELTFGAYREMGGIKRATKIENKHDGQRFLDVEITEFKVLEKLDPKTFAEPD